MRLPMLVVVVALAGGCVAPAAPESVLVAPLRGLWVQVLDDEYRPIPDAVVFIDGSPVRNVTDALGEAFLSHAKPGPVKLRAWAPLYYRAEIDAVVAPNLTEKTSIELERRPDDFLASKDDEGVLVCEFAANLPPPMPSRECGRLPNGPPSSPAFLPFRRSTEEGNLRTFHNLTATFSWSPTATDAQFVLVVDAWPNGTLAGKDRIELKGPSPRSLFLDLAAVPAGMRDGQHSARVRIALDPSENPAVLMDQKVSYVLRTVERISAPSNPDWDEGS